MRFPTPAEIPDGGSPSERLDMAFRKILTVPKTALVKDEAREKRQREKGRAAKKPN